MFFPQVFLSFSLKMAKSMFLYTITQKIIFA
jgi:hypothetical protein